MDDFKRHIEGYRRGGFTCPCCRETTKRHSRKLARQRLKQQDRQDETTDQLIDNHNEEEA
jgi:hypothetical protein